MKMHFNKTKIIATTGPSSCTYEQLLELIKAGVDVFRLNFSHGEHDAHLQVIENINKINKKFDTSIALMADLQGPKLRIGKMENDEVAIKDGDKIIISTEECIGTRGKIYLNYKDLPRDIEEGEKILIDDGKIILEVVKTDKLSTIEAIVMHGGKLKSNKGFNLPNTKLSLPTMTEKDHRDLKFALEHDIHWIALSFVRRGQDIVDLKKVIADNKRHHTKVIAKIEKPEAVENITEIINESDAIMVARGDLGIEMPIYKMPVIQKHIIEKCIRKAKPVIVATQLMESMIKSPNPTRAEATDVANAVFDGADALMVSGETSVGKYPVQVISMIRKIVAEIEKEDDIYNLQLRPHPKSLTKLSDAICFNACVVADQLRAQAIIGMTRSGYTAFAVSSYRPYAEIFVFTDRKKIINTLSMTWGVRCFYYDKMSTTDETIHDVQDILAKKGLLEKGDVVINLASMPIHAEGTTNMLKVGIID